ncbi:VOC family protein [Actinoplanes subglobosus]|uniref:VOC family protein n=1 Tax=Actinoplanes subglobosus TaxID=1547892 RepID=A0ABV8J5Y2_9ACTN
MALRLAMVNVKAGDPAALGRFWAAALGWDVFTERPGTTAVGPEGFTWPDPDALCLDFIAVPDPAAVTGRIHLDLATGSVEQQAALVARLIDLGAAPADVGQGDVPWTVLADPEGNVFCVLEPREIYRDTGPIAAIVVDCADPRAMARFWGAATGWTVCEADEDLTRLRPARGTGPFLEFLRSSGTRSGRKRLHLDLLPYRSDGFDLTRLRGLGARDADVGQGDVPWTVLADPEGNEFCVLAH